MTELVGRSRCDMAARVLADLPRVADELNRLDGAAGDGDLGITVTAAATALTDLVPELAETSVSDALRKAGLAVARSAPSTSGTLIARALLAAANVEAAPGERIDIARYFEAGAVEIEQRGGARLGQKTMLDALRPAIASLEGTIGEPLELRLDRASVAAEAGAIATQDMDPVFGRAGWLAERSRGTIDAGARLIAMLFRAWADQVGRGVAGNDQP